MKRADRNKYILWALVALLTLGAFGAMLAFSEPPPPKSVSLATGSKGGAYLGFGQKLAEQLESLYGLHVDARETRGSVENLDLLLAGEVDVAFVQGGVVSAREESLNQKGLRSIARVYSEPLWVFYRGEEVGLLKDFKTTPPEPPKRIAVGADGSGTQVIARELLRVNGIQEENAIFVKSSTKEALSAFERGELDVLFLVASPQAESIQTMLRMPGARLMNFANHSAYARRLTYLSALDISQGLLSLEENLPERGIVLLAPSATLVTREDVHPRVVELFTKVATQIFREGNLIDLTGEFPASNGLELPQHEAAEQYMADGESWFSRNLPFWLVRLISQLKLILIPLVGVLLPALKILPLLLQLRLSQQIKKRYETLRDIEGRIRGATQSREVQTQLKALRDLHAQSDKIANRLPGSFQEKLYHLKLHLRLIQTEGQERLDALQKQEGGHAAGQAAPLAGAML